MKKCAIYLAIFSLVFSFTFTGNVFAQEGQERVVEEELVVEEPTVAGSNKWVVGGSAEWWYISGPYYSYRNGEKVAEGSISSSQPGGNVFLGYDNWTFQASYRGGDVDIEMDRLDGSHSWTDEQKQKESEFTLRYLMRALGSKHFVPYLMGGYNRTTLDRTLTITTPGWTWTHTGTNTAKYETVYSSSMLGIGAVVPFDKNIGLRSDVRIAFTNAEDKSLDNGDEDTGSGIGGVMFLTGYWNILKGLNFQIGGKYQYLNGGDEVSSYSKAGFFTMLGYSYRF